MDLKTCILDSIPKGRSNRVTRGQLLYRVNRRGFSISDRQMRLSIADLRANDPDGGYWLAESLSELDSFLNQDAHRGHVILERVNAQRMHARYSAWAQGSLF